MGGFEGVQFGDDSEDQKRRFAPVQIPSTLPTPSNIPIPQPYRPSVTRVQGSPPTQAPIYPSPIPSQLAAPPAAPIAPVPSHAPTTLAAQYPGPLGQQGHPEQPAGPLGQQGHPALPPPTLAQRVAPVRPVAAAPSPPSAPVAPAAAPAPPAAGAGGAPGQPSPPLPANLAALPPSTRAMTARPPLAEPAAAAPTPAPTLQPPAPNAGSPTGWRKWVAPLAVGAGAFKSPALGEAIRDELYVEPHQKLEQQYQQRVGEQQREQAAQRQTQQDQRQASQDQLNRQNVESEIARRGVQNEVERNPPEKPREPTSEDQAFSAALKANGGDALKAYQAVREAGARPLAPAKPTFEEQTFEDWQKSHPGGSREQFVEDHENRVAARQEANQERGFAHQDQARQAQWAHQGQVTAAKEQQLTSPTRTMIEMAPTVKGFVDRIQKLTEQEANGLGPLQGRWKQFWSGEVGAPNPEYAKLKADTILMRTALLKMHVGSRGSGIMLDEFKQILDQGKDSPENMLAALGEIGAYADDLEARGKSLGVGGGAGAAAQPPAQGGGRNMIRAKDAAGKLHEAPAGTPLPKGWTLEK